MDFNGKNVIVTGGAHGIGLAVVREVTRSGGHAVIVDMDIEAAEKACAEAGSATAYRADLGDAAQIREVFARIVADAGRIHALVNNGGMIDKTPFLELSVERWNKVLAVNLTSQFLTCQAVFPNMAKYHYGRIVNVASLAAKMGGGMLGNCAYATSKAGVLGITKNLAREGAAYGIAVNAVCPGYTKTSMTGTMTPEQMTACLGSTPLGRGAEPSEIATAILFLAGDGASFITGEVMDVNGGQFID